MYIERRISEVEPICFYVSPQGNDRWSGTTPEPAAGDGPFATLERARRAVRALKRKGAWDRPVRVVLRGGTYFLDRPLEFGPQDGGTHECPVTWTSAAGEKAVVSGGRRIRGFRETAANGRRAWAADLPDVRRGDWYFRQLFVNDARCPRPRLPRKGVYRLKRPLDVRPVQLRWRCPTRRAEYSGDDFKRWRNLRDVEVVALTRWIENRLNVARVDTKRRIVTFVHPSLHTLADDHKPERGTVYWIENVFEELSRPGQWYLDRRKGRLYYLPRRGEKPDAVEMIAPRLPQLVRVVGTGKRKVEHLHFRGITFAHSEWQAPEGWVASKQAAHEVPGAIRFEHARLCSLSQCAVVHVGSYAVEVGDGCLDITLAHNRMEDLGAGGVRAWHGSARTTITDSVIAHGGRLWLSAVGVLIGNSPGNKVLHNHIFDLYYSGISVGWVWGYAGSAAVGNIVEHNHVHDLGHELLSDMGGVYTLGVSPGTRIRYNLFHDINCRIYGGWGIYMDEGSTDILIEKNIAYRCNTAPFHQHYGRDNRIVNNIWAFGEGNQIERSRIEDHLSFSFERNIVYYERGEAVGRKWDPPQAVLNHNLYWNASGGKVTFAGKSLAEWQAMGMDAESLVADPKFVDPAKGDFQLRPGSPARRIGFEPFRLLDVGPRPSA